MISPNLLAWFFGLGAAFLALRSVWEWEPARSHIPFDFQSPIVLVHREAVKTKPEPPAAPELGRMDLAVQAVAETNAMTAALQKITAEANANVPRLEKATRKFVSVQNAPLDVRHRTFTQNAKTIAAHARRMAALEVEYRQHVNAMADVGRRYIRAQKDYEDMSEVVVSSAQMREAAVGSLASNRGYLASVKSGRAQNMSQAMNGAYDDLAAVLERVIEDVEVVVDYCDWIAAEGAA